MKTRIPTTPARDSLMNTAFQNSRWFACLVAGTSALGTTSVHAVDWNGSASTDWNIAANWTPSGVPSGANALIKTMVPNIAKITANITATPVDIVVGDVGAAGSGRLDHLAGTAKTGTGNWMFVGRNGATGVYNLADTTGTGGTFTGLAKGSGSMTVGARLYIGGNAGTGSNGTVNVNTTGTLAIPTQLEIGTNTSVGTLNIDAGSVTTGDWTEIGNGVGSTGNLRMSGGSLTKTGGNQLIVAANGSTGNATVSGGTISVNNDIWVANNTGSTGTLNISGGTISNGGWAVIGRKDAANAGVGGVGTVNMSGGTWNKTGTTTNFIVGASGDGTMNMSGGLVEVSPSSTADRGITWIAEQNSRTGVLNLSGTAEFRTARFTLAVGSGTNGTLNLDGGTARTGQITGGAGTSTVNFNSTEIFATANQASFVTGLGSAIVKSGGLKVNSNGFSVTIPQILTGGSPSGGVIKNGAGTLTLSGSNTYTGGHTVNAGKLVVTSDHVGGGDFTVANGATLGVVQKVDGDALTTPSVTFGTNAASSLEINLGNFPDNTSGAPLDVTGTLTLNGPVTINVLDALPAVGSIPLVKYVGAKAGSGGFVLGSLPNGVVGTLSDNGTGLVSLNVTSVSLPVWTGSENGKWDTTTQNWIDAVSSNPTAYANPAPVRFDDTSNGILAITLDQSVTPSGVTFETLSNAYSITGTGKISGTTGLTKTGGAALTLGTANDFTGVVTLSGGTTSVNSLANGGTASAIGSASSAAANLVLDGGMLAYTGPTATIDRGFTLNAANTGISTVNDLTLSGAVANNAGNFIKSGAGNLTLTNNGPIALGTISPGVRVQEGTLTLSGSGSQAVTVAGEMFVGNLPDVNANLALNNTSLTTTNFLALGRGNGDNGVVNFTANHSTINTASFSTGYNGGLTNNASEQFITISNTAWTNNGVTYIAESGGSTTVMNFDGASQFNIAGNILIGRNAGATGTLVLKGTTSLTKSTGYTGIGAGGTGTLTLQDSASFTALDDFNVGDGANATGTLNIGGTSTVSATQVYFGKNTGTNGTVNQTGGTFSSASFITIGRFGGGTGVVNVSGGTMNQNGTATNLVVGEEGTGTLNISGTGKVVSNGTAVLVGNGGTGNGQLNLNTGGTLTALQVREGNGGNSEFNFDGGLLKANTGANANFMSGLDAVFVKAGGAFIDTNGQTLALAQNLNDGGGGLTKSGAGTLQLNGSNSYSGTTTVAAGTLAGTGSIAGALSVPTGSKIAPGVAVGNFTAGATTIGGTYVCEVSGTTADKLSVNGALTLGPGAVLDIDALAAPTAPALVIASYVSLSGTFSVQDLPSGYSLDYHYNDGVSSNNIALVSGAVTPYDAWAASYFPGVTDQNIIGPAADPDKDGSPNSLEFALGGIPNNAGDGPKIFNIIADSSDAGTNKELLLTIAVRGNPSFTNGPAPTAAADGYTYVVKGSTTLGSFASAVSLVTTVAPSAPNATPPAGYAWRTFSLDGSDGLPNKGFMRVSVEKVP